MLNSVQKEKVYNYLHRIYGSYINLIAAGCLFIAYAVLVVFDLFFVGRAFRLSGLMFRFPGLILIVMGCFFTLNAFRLRKDGHFENKILLARGIFDILAGLMILVMTRFGMMVTMLVMGLVLIHVGLNNLVKPNASLLQLILSVIMIPVGLSDIDVINYLLFYQARILIFALSLGLLGIFLVWIAGGYKQYFEPTVNPQPVYPAGNTPVEETGSVSEEKSSDKEQDESTLSSNEEDKENEVQEQPVEVVEIFEESPAEFQEEQEPVESF